MKGNRLFPPQNLPGSELAALAPPLLVLRQILMKSRGRLRGQRPVGEKDGVGVGVLAGAEVVPAVGDEDVVGVAAAKRMRRQYLPVIPTWI